MCVCVVSVSVSVSVPVSMSVAYLQTYICRSTCVRAIISSDFFPFFQMIDQPIRAIILDPRQRRGPRPEMGADTGGGGVVGGAGTGKRVCVCVYVYVCVCVCGCVCVCVCVCEGVCV